jgi:hypothetical protein
MVSKILTGGFILIMVGAVVAGAIAVLSPTKEAHDERLGHNARVEGRGQGQGQNQDQGLGRGQGQGQGLGRNSQAGAEVEAAPLELDSVQGVVVEADELMIETADGTIVHVGLGPSSYRDSQGFVLKVGEHVRTSGYWEDDEFK